MLYQSRYLHLKKNNFRSGEKNIRNSSMYILQLFLLGTYFVSGTVLTVKKREMTKPLPSMSSQPKEVTTHGSK